MDHFWKINFNKWIKFQVYKYEGNSYDNIDDEIIDKSFFVSTESSLQNSWMKAYDWWLVRKVQGWYIHKYFLIFNLVSFLKF